MRGERAGAAASDGGRRRLFFALWPEEGLRRRIARLARRLPRRRGRPVPPGNLHLTLAFVGPVDPETAHCMATAAARVTVAPFELVLDTVGGFTRAGVLWLGSSRVPAALRSLVAGLEEALQGCGYRPDPRPFTPHVTLFRRADPAAMEGGMRIEPLVWPVRDFVLVESRTDPQGAVYRVLRRYPELPGHA